MNYPRFYSLFKNFTLFSINDIYQIDKNFQRRRLNEWQDKGYIQKVVKGFYLFWDLHINEHTLFEIANRIYSPSYISFEMALSHYGLIPETVYALTSASTRRTYLYKTKLAEFRYRSLKPCLFFGYQLVQYENGVYKIATPEKALLDYFYLNSHIKTRADFLELRIDADRFFALISEEKLLTALARFQQIALTKRISSFLKVMKNA